MRNTFREHTACIRRHFGTIECARHGAKHCGRWSLLVPISAAHTAMRII
jgi:hypothetical protein